MQLRHKLGAIASGLALTVGLGIAFAGPAMAKNSTWVCVNNDHVGLECAVSFPRHLSPVVINDGIGGVPGGSLWDAPTSGTGQIRWAGSTGSGYCMEIHKDNKIVLDSCLGRASERWSVAIGSNKLGPTYFYQSVYNPKLCLTAPSQGQLTVARCNFKHLNQAWILMSP